MKAFDGIENKIALMKGCKVGVYKGGLVGCNDSRSVRDVMNYFKYVDVSLALNSGERNIRPITMGLQDELAGWEDSCGVMPKDKFQEATLFICGACNQVVSTDWKKTRFVLVADTVIDADVTGFDVIFELNGNILRLTERLMCGNIIFKGSGHVFLTHSAWNFSSLGEMHVGGKVALHLAKDCQKHNERVILEQGNNTVPNLMQIYTKTSAVCLMTDMGVTVNVDRRLCEQMVGEYLDDIGAMFGVSLTYNLRDGVATLTDSGTNDTKLNTEVNLTQLSRHLAEKGINITCPRMCVANCNSFVIDTPQAVQILNNLQVSGHIGICITKKIASDFPIHINCDSIEYGSRYTYNKLRNNVTANKRTIEHEVFGDIPFFIDDSIDEFETKGSLKCLNSITKYGLLRINGDIDLLRKVNCAQLIVSGNIATIEAGAFSMFDGDCIQIGSITKVEQGAFIQCMCPKIQVSGDVPGNILEEVVKGYVSELVLSEASTRILNPSKVKGVKLIIT